MKRFIFILSILLASSAIAADYGLYVPNGFKRVKEMFGMPDSLLGPSVEGQRIVLTIQPIPTDKFPKGFFKGDIYQKQYQQNKKRWVEAGNGKIISFYNKEKIKIPTTTEVYSIGVSYTRQEKGFHEKSFHILCGGKPYVAKWLIPLIQKDKYLKEMDKVVRSFRCPK